MEEVLKMMTRKFSDFLQLETHIVAVKNFEEEESYNNWTFKEHKHAMYYCYFVKRSHLGETYKFTSKQIACETASKVLGLETYFDEDQGPKDWLATGAYSCLSQSKRKHDELKAVKSVFGMATGPLKNFCEEPDSLIMVVNAHQAMRLLQAYNYTYSKSRSFNPEGMCGVCYESTALPQKSKDLSISMLCSGTRFICKWSDDAIIISFPFSMAKNILKGLIETANPCELDEKKIKIKATSELKESQDLVVGKSYFRY